MSKSEYIAIRISRKDLEAMAYALWHNTPRNCSLSNRAEDYIKRLKDEIRNEETDCGEPYDFSY